MKRLTLIAFAVAGSAALAALPAGGDDRERKRLCVDAEDLHAVPALAGSARGGGWALGVVLMTLDRRADGEQQA